MNPKVRVRFAPSPTGALHIGGVRTALYNYLFAKKNNGDFILRIEDTDSSRFVEKAEDYIKESFNWLGIEFDESPYKGGPFGPYKQSERKEIYVKYVNQLLDSGDAYIAFDTQEELEIKRKEINNFQYDSTTRLGMRNSLSLSKNEVEELIDKGLQYVVRIKIEQNIDIKVKDLIRGEIIINSSILDDKVLYKSSDGLPTYHMANIVDDHLMHISHVIRGEEWLPSAPLHVLLYKKLGWENTMPQFAHLPLILKPEGNGKLSKRDGDKFGFPVFPLKWTDPKTEEISLGYREFGYLPEAMINFLAMLGWNSGNNQEIYTIDELISEFSFERCSKSGAKFDYEKSKWFNHKYIQQKSNEYISKYLIKELEISNIEYSNSDKLLKIIELVKERLFFLTDLWEQTKFFFIAPNSYDEKIVKKYWKEDTSKNMLLLLNEIEGIEDFSSQNQETVIMQWINLNEFGVGKIMNAFRLSIVGTNKGPHLFDITEVIGKRETIERLKCAISKISL